MPSRHRRLVARLSAVIAATAAATAVGPLAFAHEAYVLTARQFQAGLKQYSPDAFAPLLDPSHWSLFLLIAALVAASFGLSFVFATLNTASILDRWIRAAKDVGPLIIRLTMAAAFLFSARANVIFGPELQLSALAGGSIVQFLLFLTGLMLLFGLFVELAAVIGIGLFAFACAHFGLYLVTYANYLGELIALTLFGSRYLSLDRYFFGERLWIKKLRRLAWTETPIIRIFYGACLAYAGFTVKFLHQQLTIDVYNKYHLFTFFHASASFIAAGAGLAEIMIGVFIMFGFAQRWTILISLGFITLSLLYFQELIWPHLMLYGISISLFINSSDPLTFDHYVVPWLRGALPEFLHHAKPKRISHR